MINNYQYYEYEEIENQVNIGDVIDLISEDNSDCLTISDTWREIVSDLCAT